MQAQIERIERFSKAEYFIKKYRLENAFVQSPVGLSVISMLGLSFFCFVIQRPFDLLAYLSIASLGLGVFLHSLAKTLDKLRELRRELQRAELETLSGVANQDEVLPPTYSDGFWSVELPQRGALRVRNTPSKGGNFIVLVDGNKFFEFWVKSATAHTRKLPPLRAETRKTNAFTHAEQAFLGDNADSMDAPKIRVTRARGISIRSKRNELAFLLACNATSFPILVDTLETAVDLHKAAGVGEEPIEVTNLR